MTPRLRLFMACLALLMLSSTTQAQGLKIPRAQDRPPGPALSAEEAAAKMTVPEGFTVEVVASEPDLMNPVAMCIDEQGRFWVTAKCQTLVASQRRPASGVSARRIVPSNTK